MNIRIILILLIAPTLVHAGQILHENSDVRITDPLIDTSEGTNKALMEVIVDDFQNDKVIDMGYVDLYTYGIFSTDQMDVLLLDYCRDRALIATTKQAIYINYKILDLKEMVIDSIGLDSLNKTPGTLHISRDCKYIVCFGDDITTEEDPYKNPDQRYTCTFDAETFKPLAIARGFRGYDFFYPNGYYFPHGDSVFYLHDPQRRWGNGDLLKISLPDLEIIDTIRIHSLGPNNCKSAITFGVEDSLALICYKWDDGQQIKVTYKIINVNLQKIISEWTPPDNDIYTAAKMSGDAKWVAFQKTDNQVMVSDINFNQVLNLTSCGDFRLPFSYFDNGILKIGCGYEDGIGSTWDLNTATLVHKTIEIIEEHK